MLGGRGELLDAANTPIRISAIEAYINGSTFILIFLCAIVCSSIRVFDPRLLRLIWFVWPVLTAAFRGRLGTPIVARAQHFIYQFAKFLAQRSHSGFYLKLVPCALAYQARYFAKLRTFRFDDMALYLSS